MIKNSDKGKWAEKQAQLYLDDMSSKHFDFAFHRFPDARAARGALAAQPSDYLVSRAVGDGNMTTYLEVKECANPRRLPKSKIGQYGNLKKFYLTNAEVVVLVFMSAHNHWVLLQATQEIDDLFHYDECPASFDLSQFETFETAREALESFFF